MNHTPTPWIVLPPSEGIDANWHVSDEADTFVAHVYGFNHSVDEQSRINAKLIAAAPELLDFCRQFVAEFEVHNITNSRSAAYANNDAAGRLHRLAQAVIAKATGEQT